MAVFCHEIKEQGKKYKKYWEIQSWRYKTVHFYVVGLKNLAVQFITVFSALFRNAENIWWQ